MLASRLGSSQAVARCSHAIRTRTSRSEWFAVDSTNVDELSDQPLPSAMHQLAALIEQLKQKAGDEPLSEIVLGVMTQFVGIVGAVDEEAIKHLLFVAAQQGLLELDVGMQSVRLTMKAWQRDLPAQVPVAPPPQAKDSKTSKTTRGHCPGCGPKRNATIVAQHVEEAGRDQPVWTRDTYSVLKCDGCDEVYVQRNHFFSEDTLLRLDQSGEYQETARSTITYWPAPSARQKPEWLDSLADEALRTVLAEVYGALNGDQRTLAAIGARTALDRAMTLLGAESPGFADRLKELERLGHIGSGERETLMVLTDAGNASAHRAWLPSSSSLATILSGTEAFFHRNFVLTPEISAMKGEIPQRAKRKG